MFDWLSFITFLPIIGVIILFFIPTENRSVIKTLSLIFTILTLLFSIVLLLKFKSGFSDIQFEVNNSWIPMLGISYHIGVDGISIFLYLLTTVLFPIIILSSFNFLEKNSYRDKIKHYMISMLFLETAILGALISFDLILFYIFWEIMLVPMYLLIGIFGGENRVYATLKFFIYTMAGSIFMLISIFYLYFKAGGDSFDYYYILDNINLSLKEDFWLFIGFAIAFAIKVPIFPFHTWLPDAHVQAPTGGSVILAGVLLKMGGYGFIRFSIPFFPISSYKLGPWIATLAVIGVIYGALIAMVQKDIKKLVAYSSISHLGFVILGIFAFSNISTSGAVFQMLSHGISTGGLFLVVGILYERRGTKQIADFGGVAQKMPIFATIFMIIMLSSIALPLTNGFIGEFLILSGAYSSIYLKNAQLLTILATTGVILGASYMLWLYRRVMFGPIKHEENKKLKDLNSRETIYFIPIVLIIFFMGLFPNFFLSKMEPSIENYVTTFNKKIELYKKSDKAQLKINIKED